MRQVIGLMRRAVRRLGVLGRKRGRHTAANLADVRQRQAPAAKLPQRRRHGAAVAPGELRPQATAAAPAVFRASASPGELRRPAAAGMSQARGVLSELRREATPPRRRRTVRGAELHVMPRVALPDSVSALVRQRDVVPASMLPSRWAVGNKELYVVLMDGLARL